MGDFDNIGLSLESYKSFGPGLIGFEHFASVNVIVGRNNSGKSALIDLIELVTEKKAILSNLYNANTPSRFVLSAVVGEPAARHGFPQTTGGGPFPRGNHWDAAGKELVGADIRIDISAPDKKIFVELNPNVDHLASGDITSLYQKVAEKAQNPFEGKSFHRVSADHDVANEQIMEGLHFEKSGRGFTSTVAQILSMVVILLRTSS